MYNPMTTAVARVKDSVRSWLGEWPMSEFPRALGVGAGTSTGVAVSEHTALNYSAVYAAVALVSGDVASLPLILYKREKDGSKQRYYDSKVYEMLHDAPNPEMTSMVMREVMHGHVMTWGNAYAEIERDEWMRPVGLWPITPDRVSPKRNGRQLFYEVSNGARGPVSIDPKNMIHIPGLGFDGTQGYSVVQMAKECISLGLATERFGGTFFGNGSTFGGVLSTEQKLDKEAKQSIREAIDAVHTGPERAHKFVILGGGMKYDKLGVPPNDAQFLETRRFQIAEIARWFQIPPHKLGDLERATFSNIEQQDIEYYRSCLRRWLVRWEQELSRKLIAPLERKQQFIKHNAEGFLRGDSAARSTFYREMFNIGAYSINMILESEDLNKIGPEGDVHFVQGNLLPAEIAKDGPPKPLPALPSVKELPAGDDVDEDESKRAMTVLLAELAKNAEDTRLALVAEQEARTETAKALHQQEVSRLEEIRGELQQQLSETRDQATLDAMALQDTAEAARQETEAERAARAEAEAGRDVAVHETAIEKEARDAAERRAADAAIARAEAELAFTAQVAAALAASAADAQAKDEAERARLDAEESLQAERAAREVADTAAAHEAQIRAIETVALTEHVEAARAEAIDAARRALEAETARGEAEVRAREEIHAREVMEAALAARVEAATAAAERARQEAVAAEQAASAASAAESDARAAALLAEERRTEAVQQAADAADRLTRVTGDGAHALAAAEADFRQQLEAATAAVDEARTQAQQAEALAEARAVEAAGATDKATQAELQRVEALRLADVELTARREAEARAEAAVGEAEASRDRATAAEAEMSLKLAEAEAAVATARALEEDAQHVVQAEQVARQAAEARVDAAETEVADSLRRAGEADARAEEALRRLSVTEAQLAATAAEKDAARESLAERDLALQESRSHESARMLGVVAAHRALIVDAMGRMVRRETEKARRHQATGEKLRHWADSFYVTHEEMCVEVLRPAVRAHLAWKQSGEEVDAVTQALVRDYIAESERHIRAVADGDPEDLAVALERTLRRWEETRPDAFADRLLQDQLQYLRHVS